MDVRFVNPGGYMSEVSRGQTCAFMSPEFLGMVLVGSHDYISSTLFDG
jgi:hypothetical protein